MNRPHSSNGNRSFLPLKVGGADRGRYRVAKLASRRALFAPLAIGLLAAGMAGFFMSGAVAQAQEQETTLPAHYDTDGDGLIEIGNLDQLNAVRWDRYGDGHPSTRYETNYAAAFPVAEDGSVCPSDTKCTGYELTADLDFDTDGSGDANDADDYWNGGAGWRPINYFWAKFDGNGHTISNLYINRPSGAEIGLFESTSPGEVRRLGLEGVDVTGGANVGALAGSSSSSITGSYAAGTVNGTGIFVGGLVGQNNGPISTSYATGTVNGTRGFVGGLVGLTTMER